MLRSEQRLNVSAPSDYRILGFTGFAALVLHVLDLIGTEFVLLHDQHRITVPAGYSAPEWSNTIHGIMAADVIKPLLIRIAVTHTVQPDVDFPAPLPWTPPFRAQKTKHPLRGRVFRLLR